MFTIENICDVLKDDMGVKEIILEIEGQDTPCIEIRGDYQGKPFNIKAYNHDFAEHGL